MINKSIAKMDAIKFFSYRDSLNTLVQSWIDREKEKRITHHEIEEIRTVLLNIFEFLGTVEPSVLIANECKLENVLEARRKRLSGPKKALSRGKI